MLVMCYGLFWKEDEVFWGRGSNPGTMFGVLSTNKKAGPVDFREQSGVYVLYADYDIVYIGQAGNRNQKLFERIKQHKRDALAERWNRFSWFGTRRVLTDGGLSKEKEGAQTTHEEVLNHIEAILIHAAEPKLNRQGGRFGDGVEQYLQFRDANLGPSTEEMIHSIWEAQKKR